MHSTDEAPADGIVEVPPESSRSPVSVALLAAIACVPIVIAAGFLTDRRSDPTAAGAVPGDISVLALRGRFDAAADRRPDLPVRAGY